MQNKFIQLEKQQIIFEDLGIIRYKAAWDYQDEKVNENLKIKSYSIVLLGFVQRRPE